MTRPPATTLIKAGSGPLYDAQSADIPIPIPKGSKRAPREFYEFAKQPGTLAILLGCPVLINPARCHRPPVNLHQALLPRHRGMYPIAHAILEGDTFTGNTLHEIDATFDTGPIVNQSLIGIDPDDTAESLHAHLIRDARQSLTDNLAWIMRGDYTPIPQPQSIHASYHDAESLDFSSPDISRYIADPVLFERAVRAFYYPQYQTALLHSQPVIPRAEPFLTRLGIRSQPVPDPVEVV